LTVAAVALDPLPHAARHRGAGGGREPGGGRGAGAVGHGDPHGRGGAGSGLMAVGGAFLTMSAFSSFFFEMINGRGWICIALVVFGAWRPGKALIGAILFAAFDAYQVRLQQTALAADIPYQVFLMIPLSCRSSR
jgi:hypothetical protein